MRQWATEIWEVFSELHNEVEELIEAGDGDTIVSVQKTHGRMRHSGLEAHFRWAAVWTFRAGKVRRAQRLLACRKCAVGRGR
jgi:ketosteroid isomerase-like protein